MVKIDPELQALINSLVAADKSRISAKGRPKTTGKNAAPKITWTGPKEDAWNKDPKKDSGSKGPSNFHKILDILDRPLNALQGGIIESADDARGMDAIKGFLGGVGRGFTGKENYTGKQIVNQHGYTGRGAGTTGFLLDVAMDPLNLIPVGAGVKAAKGLAGKTDDVAEEIVEKAAPTLKQPGKAFTGQKILPDPKVTTGPVKSGSVGKAQQRAVELETPAPIVLPKPKDVPAPKPPKFEDLPPEVKGNIVKQAQAKLVANWESTEFAQKLGRGNGPMPWAKIATDPARFQAIKSTPEFKALWAKHLADEKNLALSAIAGKELATHHDMVKALDQAAPTVADKIVEVADEVLKPAHKKVAESALLGHNLIHGERSLTVEGQAKLRQRVATEYLKSKKGAVKASAPAVQRSIARIYKEAEAQLAKTQPIAPGAKLSDIIDDLPYETASDPAKLIEALKGADVKDIVTQAASELPKVARKPYIAGVMAALKNAGNATEVAQVAAKPNRHVTMDAIYKDMAASDVKFKLPKVSDKVLRSDAEYVSKLAFLGRAGEAIDKAFNTAYNMSKLERAEINAARGAVNTLKERDITFLRNIIRGTNKEGVNAAFKGAQAGANEAKATELSNYFGELADMMRKAGVSEQEFLEHVKRNYYLKEVLKDADVAKGFDIWKDAKIGNSHAAKLMAWYTDIAHNATLDAAVAGNLGKHFGAVTGDEAMMKFAKQNGYIPVKDVPSLQGVLFPPDIAPRIKQLLDEVGPKGNRAEGFLKHYDKGLSLYKVGLTKYLPSHHINNHIGSVYMNWLDGLTDVRWYSRSISLMKHDQALRDGVIPEGATFKGLKTGSGEPMDAQAVLNAFEERGLRPTRAGIADLAGEEPMIKGAIPTAVDRFSSAREVQVRLAHFMYALSTEKGPLEDVIRNAALRVQKSHADYSDLTEFERKVMRRVIPFYTWQRKVAPTLLRQAATNPAKLMVYPKLQQQINSHFGIEPEPGNPFPGLSMVPSFLTEGTAAVYGTRDNGNVVLGGARTPFDDLIGKQLNHPVGNIVGQVTPAVRIPMELWGEKSLANPDIKVINKNTDRLTYLEQQTPLLSVLMRLTRRDPAHGFAPTRKGEDEQGPNWLAVLNLLTAGGLQENNKRFQAIAEREQK